MYWYYLDVIKGPASWSFSYTCLKKALLRNEANVKLRGLKYEFTEVDTKNTRKPSINSILWVQKDIVNSVGSWYGLRVPFCCFSWYHCNQTRATMHYEEDNGLISWSFPCLKCLLFFCFTHCFPLPFLCASLSHRWKHIFLNQECNFKKLFVLYVCICTCV